MGRVWTPGWHRMDNGVGVGRVHICTLTKNEKINMKVKWEALKLKAGPEFQGTKLSHSHLTASRSCRPAGLGPASGRHSERGVAGPVFVFCTVALRAETDILPPVFVVSLNASGLCVVPRRISESQG